MDFHFHRRILVEKLVFIREGTYLRGGKEALKGKKSTARFQQKQVGSLGRAIKKLTSFSHTSF